ncbi:MAG: prolipoprotein diacylglyceryl transferase [bacterium]|nr:prolipoprotein diacylglyceryl transferase [bacterium]
MHPVLIKIGWFNIYSFGFMLAVSFLVGIYMSTRRAKTFGVDPQYILDLSVYIILAGVIGSRLLYVVFHLDEYRSLVDVFALWQGGATLYGGFLLSIFVIYVFTKKRNLDYLLVADIVSPALALGIMLTRVGCFLSGCCYGKPTELAWGVVFPPDSAAGVYARQIAASYPVEAVALHPTQLYASFFGMVTLLFLLLFRNKLTKRGSTFGALLMLYGTFRFTLDFFRFYEGNMRVLLDLSLNQWISLGMFGVGLFFVLRRTNVKTVPVALSQSGQK